MTNRKEYAQKIQEKRKTSNFRDFIKEIASRCPIIFHRNNNQISRYPETERSPKVRANKMFEQERWNMLSYGQDHHSNSPFFDQFFQLRKEVPQGATIRQMAWENTTYADSVVASSHSYLSSMIINECSNIYYSFLVFDYCQNVFNSFRIQSYCENIYQSVGIIKSTNIFFSQYCENSSDIRLSSNLIWCHHCLLCHGLQNQSYYIKNQKVTKEQFQKAKKILQDTPQAIIETKLPRKGENRSSEWCTGKWITNSSRVKRGYFINRLYHWRNVIGVGWSNQEKNFYDVFDGGVNSSDMYANEWTWSNSNNIYCCSQVEQSSRCFYSFNLVNCSFCLGCIGLQNKSHCIFNKQYSKQEREEKVLCIFEKMEKDGELWDFFPANLCPFYHNETMAHIFASFDKDEIKKDWYLWRDEKLSFWWAADDYILAKSLDKKNYDKSILQKTIKDKNGHCFKIIPQELVFLKKHQLPLPQEHWISRIKKLIKEH